MRSTNLIKIHEGAKAFYGALIDFLPDVESFQNEVYRVQPLLGTPKDNQHSLLEFYLQRQLELLQSQVIQMKSDVCGMTSTIQMMVENSSKSGFNSSVPASAVMKDKNQDGGEDDYENSYASKDDSNDSQKQLGTQDKPQPAGSLKVKPAKSLEKKPERKKKITNSTYARSKCFICDLKISNRLKHMKKYHPGLKNFPCKFCGRAFNKYKEFQDHKKSHVAVHRFKCDLCNATLKSLKYLSRHLKSHTGRKFYVCHICGRNFKSKISVTNCKHKGRKESNLSFQCKLCPKSFQVPWLLRQHINFHTGETPFRCEYCYKQFHTSSEKRVHKYLKHSRTFQGYKCKICGTMCKSRLGRETHYLTHTQEEMAYHNIVVKMIECDVCGKVVRKNYLMNHKTTHASKDAFICEICGKGFKRAARLKEHTLRHTQPQLSPQKRPEQKPDKNHVCNVCGKTFYNRCHLLVHKRVHTGERPFLCKICGKAFTTIQSYKNHGVVHTKIKAFKCEMCGDSFTLQRNLKRHYSVHTGYKPFQCDFCDKRFVQKVNLDCHRRVHTGERPFQCSYCGKKFADPSTLYKHKAKHK